ncbi:MAG: hypothetical protein P1U81_19605 [Verrucomicrobiales bacterium]|jgi:hypothetical protein|nr:hypothetical protein [Verrucomicrobiales bacterium]
MKRILSLLVLVTLPASLRAAKVEMPEWEETSAAASYQLGGGLWPTGLIDGEDENETSPTSPSAETADTPSPEQALQFYGPGGTTTDEPIRPDIRESEAPQGSPDGVPEVIVETPAIEALPPIEGDLKDIYFAHAPVEFLVDPQRLLTEQKSNDIKRFLEFHSDESEFHIYVLVIGETQTIPEDIDLKALHREWFEDSSTVMMLYYREDPAKTEFVYNDKVRSALPKSVFDRIELNTLREGGATDLAPDQVEKMAIELSIQLYWLSRLMDHESKEDQERIADTPIHELAASEDAPELLREYAPGIFIEESGLKLVSFLFTTLLVVGVILGMAGVGWLVMWWRAQDRFAGSPLIFPSYQIVPRLGGEYSGGGFVSMSFDIREGSDFVD